MYLEQLPQRILMGPGPSNLHPKVLAALSTPTIGHLDPEFCTLMEETKALLRKTFLTENDCTFPISGPGSAGMEAILVNLLEPGERILVCINGLFGERILQCASRLGAEAIPLRFSWGQPIDPGVLREKLEQIPGVAIVAFVHGETSTGALSDAHAICQVAKGFGCLTLADTVTTLGGSELRVDAWRIDAAFSGSQKCLSAPPGLAPITLSPAAVDKVRHRKSKTPTWFFDLNLILDYWNGSKNGGARTYHHTAPVHQIYGLYAALKVLHEEGLENAWQRHLNLHRLLKRGLHDVGLRMMVPEWAQLPQLNSVKLGQTSDEPIRVALRERFNIEIGSGLGPLAGRIWRIGLMGHSCSLKNVETCIAALRELV